MAKNRSSPPKANGANLGFEQKLWQAADKMRGHMDASEYKHVVLGLIFLKFVSDAFEERHQALLKEKGADPEDRDEYLAENIFWVPKQEAAVRKMQEHFDVVSSMFHGFDYSKYISGKPAEQVKVVPNAIEHVLAQENGKMRYMPAVSALSRAFALSVPHEKAMAVRDQVGFFQTVRAALAKHTTDDTSAPEMLDAAVRQIVSRAVASDEVIDIFTAAGLQTPDISILSDAFLEEVRRLPQKNLAIEALRKLLNDQLKTQSKKNLVQSRLFSDMLQQTIQKYQNRSLDTAEIIAELVNLAKNMRESNSRGEKLKMSDEEIAFYDALEVNDSAVKVLGDETLRQIALELVEAVRKNASIDWTVKESVRAKMRTIVKRVLRQHGYPPDKQEKATLTVLAQAELLCKDWVA